MTMYRYRVGQRQRYGASYEEQYVARDINSYMNQLSR